MTAEEKARNVVNSCASTIDNNPKELAAALKEKANQFFKGSVFFRQKSGKLNFR